MAVCWNYIDGFSVLWSLLARGHLECECEHNSVCYLLEQGYLHSYSLQDACRLVEPPLNL